MAGPVPAPVGAGNLHSVEYYRLMRRVLNPRGIALQWVGSTGETEYKMIMRTFVTVFPHTTLWHGGSLMVGSSRPLVLEEDSFLRKQASAQSRGRSPRWGSRPSRCPLEPMQDAFHLARANASPSGS